MLLETTIILLGAGTWYKVSKQPKRPAGMTAGEKLVFDNLINQPHEENIFLEMAEVFDRNGFKDQADLLRKRAKLRTNSPETKAAHKQAFRDGMKSDDPEGVERLARAFQKQGATGNAAALRTYAVNLRTSQAVTPPPAANASAVTAAATAATAAITAQPPAVSSAETSVSPTAH